jgi:hypothetical protein
MRRPSWRHVNFLSAEIVRRIVEPEGHRVLPVQKDRRLDPGWCAEDCRLTPESPSCVITGSDEVKVPLVTNAEKQNVGRTARKAVRQPRRKVVAVESVKARIRRPTYKEFKIVAFYDPLHEHQ